MAYVRNIPNTGKRNCKCGSWIAHWEKFSNKKSDMCSVKDCTEKGSEGAHVRSLYSDRHFIIPLCSTHNKVKDIDLDIYLSVYISMISANVAETCGN
ncbi:MAG TPA: hypothetical protein VNX01_02555 [Bacteroidia bacterium]|jgi:hypothetical protein|nr:hypothetical protein [Bacteroidia bacterium]